MADRKLKPLGETQTYVLASLKRHGGYWYSGCGWMWDNKSGTTKIMESLLKRGLVTKATVLGATRYTLKKDAK